MLFKSRWLICERCTCVVMVTTCSLDKKNRQDLHRQIVCSHYVNVTSVLCMYMYVCVLNTFDGEKKTLGCHAIIPTAHYVEVVQRKILLDGKPICPTAHFPQNKLLLFWKYSLSLQQTQTRCRITVLVMFCLPQKAKAWPARLRLEDNTLNPTIRTQLSETYMMHLSPLY